MKYTLVGNTGFVGRSLASATSFDALYNRGNIEESFGADNGLVVYSGMPCDRWAAATDPEADFVAAKQAMENISRMRPERLVLISTADVYPRPAGVYEDTPIPAGEGNAYGRNRYALEGWVREAYPEALIVRLPALFGEGLRQNYIYDMLIPAPRFLSEEHYAALSLKQALVATGYEQDAAGNYRLCAEGEHLDALKDFFALNDFNALSLTDSRSVLQFYDLSNLWADINCCLKLGLLLVNFATAPVEAGALYHYLFGEEFENLLAGPPERSDVRTRYGREFGGHDDYLSDRTEVVAGIAKYVGHVLETGVL